ncbi:retrotransposon protein, putative, ty1-copia subclass [Tanacetum coccineum]
MFEISGNNFNDWFRRLKLSLRVEKKMHVIEQPLPPAPEPVADPNVVAEWTALYDAHTEIASLMLGSMTSELHRQFELYYPYDMLQEIKSMFEKQAGVEWFDLIQTFHACKQDEGKPCWFNLEWPYYKKHNMGKTVGELHVMLIEYENGLPKKAEIRNRLKLKHPAKDNTCHHCKEVGHCKRNCPAYLAELIKKKKKVGTASSSDVFIIELFSFPTKS